MATIHLTQIRYADRWTRGFGLCGGLLRSFMRRQERADQRHALETMEDHILRNIGLDQAAARLEASKPFWQA